MITASGVIMAPSLARRFDMTRRRWLVLLLSVPLALTVLAAAALFWGTQLLKAQVESALGPDSEIGEIRLDWNRIELHRLHIRAPRGWPTADALRAERITVTPDLRGLLSSQIRIDQIAVDGAYLSLLRTPQGRLRVLPSLLERTPAEPGKPLPPIEISSVTLRGAALDFFDATVRTPPLKLVLAPVQADIGPLRLPALDGRSTIEMQAQLKDKTGDGHIAVEGWVELSSRDMELATKMRGVDLTALQPYLVKAANTGVKRGTLDLDVRSTVQQHRLHAPGTLTLHRLELEAGGALGLPRSAVIGLMKDRREDIVIKFELDGKLDDPQFKLNENIAARFTSGLAESLGIGIEGLAAGAAGLGQKGVEAVGGAFRKLFGSDR